MEKFKFLKEQFSYEQKALGLIKEIQSLKRSNKKLF